VLKGALYFLADLSRAISLPTEVDILAVSSYTGTQSSGTVTILKDLDIEIHGRDILIVEDILDTGRTLNAIKECLSRRRPRSLRICVLLDKPDRRTVPVSVDYTGFTIPNHFVIGYGLDLNQVFRNLPYIAILNPA
jgi:hypoxanthine phosphoribosyltransferase